MKGYRHFAKSALFLTLIGLSAHVMAESAPVGCKIGERTLKNLTCYGAAILQETTITSSLQIEGPLDGNNVTLDAMTVDGPVVLHESTVNGLVDIEGELRAHEVDFEKSVMVAGNKATLTDSNVQGSMRITSKDDGTPYLRMECGTKVVGSVTFVGKPGIVQLSDDSDVQGKIVNGELEFIDMKDSDCKKLT